MLSCRLLFKCHRVHQPLGKGEPLIAKGRFQSRKDDKRGKQLRTNERIRVSPIRLVDQDNEQVGVVDTADALRMAREANQDLVEVAPGADPPVCRIMDYGKWKYQQKKKEQKAKTHSKHNEMKEVRLRPKTEEHDMQIKADRARHFMEDGHKVQFTMIFRGREMAHRDIGMRIFREIAERFSDFAKIEAEPRIHGNRMTMILSPGGGIKKPKKDAGESAAPQEKAE